MPGPVVPRPAGELADRLQAWYRESGRDLPWRRTRDPYRIWVSEVMLQQTQVGKVLPYYRRFLQRFPTIQELACASEDEVLGLWSGLGYYSRARRLLSAARLIVERHRGRFPAELQAALALPGVGRYTAGAVLSIAYDHPLPILDGNIRRVLARLLALDLEPGRGLDRALWEVLEELMSRPAVREQPAAFNQSLMELGALVCRPARPRCGHCPLEGHCLARRAGLIEQLPRPRRRRPAQELHFFSAVIPDGDRFLMRRNTEETYLQGFWEFPRVAAGAGATPAASAFDEAFGVAIRLERRLPPVRHAITYRRLFFHPVIADLQDEPPPGWRWLSFHDPGFPMSSYIEKIAALVESRRRPTPI